jgi:hypothetical protein
MPSPAFNNRRLFSDYYLESVVPTLPEWRNAAVDAAEAQQELRFLWEARARLVEHNEMQTEEHWIRPVLTRLGYAFQVQPSVPDAHGITRWPDYALFESEIDRAEAEAHHGTISYFRRALAIADAKMWDTPLDKGSRGIASAERRNPNFQIDAYLRETDRRWGLISNGRLWRLYSRDTSYRLDSFFEVDLIALLRGSVDEFMYFWAFFNASALRSQPDAFVDRVAQESHAFAEQLSTRVKDRVYQALLEFINGFFVFSRNELNTPDHLETVYSNSLILLYRILFVLYGEAHELLPVRRADYADTYSLARIKTELAERLDSGAHLLPDADNYYADLLNLFTIIHDGAPQLGVPQYNGGLFSSSRHPFLATYRMGDLHLARGLDLLARVPSEDGAVFVDYTTLEIRHLGDIYEGLLEYHPRFADVDMAAVRSGRVERWIPATDLTHGDRAVARASAGSCYLATGKGERRATGSYYTPQAVVTHMVGDSLGRAVVELEGEYQGAALVDALLNLRVCDPAMGSGHFLVESVEHLARAIVRADAAGGEEEGSELLFAKRQVVERCVYGVDPNPLAVELAKLSLWLATVAKDAPLSFVDAHLICGNSLIGTTVDVMGTLRGDRGEQTNLVEDALARITPRLVSLATELSAHVTQSMEDVKDKERLLAALEDLRAGFVQAADLWTASRFGLDVDPVVYLNVLSHLAAGDGQRDTEAEQLVNEAQVLASQFRFFHWELAFPEVFLSDERPRGFDVVVTNPPYVSAIERRRTHSDLESKYLRNTLWSAQGAFDLYIPFIEQSLSLCRAGGWACLITPNKYLAAPYARAFREGLVDRHELARLIDGSAVPVFDDPMVYPVISLYRASLAGTAKIEVGRLASDLTVLSIGEHSTSTLTMLPENLWSCLLLEDAGLLLRMAQQWPALEGSSGLRAVASTTTAEASSYGSELHEEHLAPSEGWRVVTTGTIKAFAGDWGISRLTQHGRKYLRPVLPFRAASVTHARRDLFWGSKLVFKKLALRLEAQLDRHGEYASLNTNFVMPGTVDLFTLAALMHSTVVNWIYEGYFGALRMSGGYMQVQAPQLRVLPIPPLGGVKRPEEWDAISDRYQTIADIPTANVPQADVPELLGVCGRAWADAAECLRSAREDTVTRLLEAFGVQALRTDDPAFAIPRQDAILSYLEATPPDLSGFWPLIRATGRQLKVDISREREASITAVGQAAIDAFGVYSAEIRTIRDKVDDLSCLMYQLNEHERAAVRSGHSQMAALEDDSASER